MIRKLGRVILVLFFLALSTVDFWFSNNKLISSAIGLPSRSLELNVSRLGKDKSANFHTQTYVKGLPFFSPLEVPNHLLPPIVEDLTQGLHNQMQLLKYQKQGKKHIVDSLLISREDMIKTVEMLLEWTQNPKFFLDENFNAYKIRGRDKKGNVKFTGYFSPIIDVDYQQGGEYLYPIYQKPTDTSLYPLPTRHEIESKGALAGKGLEIAWTKSRADTRSLQLQGSGFIRYPNGKRELLVYNGNNKRYGKTILPSSHDTIPTKTMTRSYVFFKKTNKRNPIGAGSVPVMPIYSVAADPRYIPLGSCLLAAVPIIDERGKLKHHELQILLVQDTGGAIKGTGHLDWYMGIGIQAEHKARYMSHFGQVWLLLPKKG